jgi:hypothetical protein
MDLQTYRETSLQAWDDLAPGWEDRRAMDVVELAHSTSGNRVAALLFSIMATRRAQPPAERSL